MNLLKAYQEAKENEDGNKVDLYRVEQGEQGSGKVLKGVRTFVLAVGTLGLSEIIADPMTEDKQMVIFQVTYDKDERVDIVKFLQLPK
jgi:hypothetical protein